MASVLNPSVGGEKAFQAAGATEVGPIERFAESINARPVAWLSVFVLILAAQASTTWYPTRDASAYLSIARSIAETGAPRQFGSESVWFAIGYPLLIAPAYWLPGDPAVWLAVFQFVFAIALMLGAYAWARRVCPTVAVIVAGLSVGGMGYAIHYRRTLSEAAFMALAIWGVYWLDRLAAAATKDTKGTSALLGLTFVAATTLVRYAGLTLAMGFAARMLFEAIKGRRTFLNAILLSAAIGLPSVAVVGGSILVEKARAEKLDTITYLDFFRAQSSRGWESLRDGLWLRTSAVGQVVTPGMFKAPARITDPYLLNMLIYAPVVVLVAWGSFRMIRRTSDVFAWSFPFYFALHVVYAYDDGGRFMVPAAPYFFACLWFVFEPIRDGRTTIMAALLIGHLGATAAQFVGQEMPLGARCRRAERDLAPLASMIKAPEAYQVATKGTSLEESLLLQKLLDRPVLQILSEGQRGAPPFAVAGPTPPDATRWLITPVDTPIEKGFEIVARSTDHLLLTRVAAGR